ncbi:LytTR family transcriptional regulator DNA-binding domain-containing protein [Chitinophagales bacterium]|nr:LytTR family transcriptional regulator DNA-binding domain-containing protein [Chitinophagales bacterium]
MINSILTVALSYITVFEQLKPAIVQVKELSGARRIIEATMDFQLKTELAIGGIVLIFRGAYGILHWLVKSVGKYYKMKRIKVLIVEDEVIVAKDIAYYLTKMGCDVFGILMHGEEVMPFLKKDQADIILMDITLKGKLDGVQTAHLVKQQYDIPIVFLTANTDDTSFELAKATKPFAFVEKPFSPKQLVRTIGLLIEQIASTSKEATNEETDSFVLSDRIFVRANGKMVKVFLSDILFIEAAGSYSKMVTDDREYVIAVNLQNLGGKIANDSLVRVHRSYIINIKRIDSMEENEVLIQTKTIPVSRSHRSEFLKKLTMI